MLKLNFEKKLHDALKTLDLVPSILGLLPCGKSIKMLLSQRNRKLTLL